jgi:hypothetical protein
LRSRALVRRGNGRGNRWQREACEEFDHSNALIVASTVKRRQGEAAVFDGPESACDNGSSCVGKVMVYQLSHVREASQGTKATHGRRR